jgi:hypothetical protein
MRSSDEHQWLERMRVLDRDIFSGKHRELLLLGQSYLAFSDEARGVFLGGVLFFIFFVDKCLVLRVSCLLLVGDAIASLCWLILVVFGFLFRW